MYHTFDLEPDAMTPASLGKCASINEGRSADLLKPVLVEESMILSKLEQRTSNAANGFQALPLQGIFRRQGQGLRESRVDKIKMIASWTGKTLLQCSKQIVPTGGGVVTCQVKIHRVLKRSSGEESLESLKLRTGPKALPASALPVKVCSCTGLARRFGMVAGKS